MNRQSAGPHTVPSSALLSRLDADYYGRAMAEASQHLCDRQASRDAQVAGRRKHLDRAEGARDIRLRDPVTSTGRRAILLGRRFQRFQDIGEMKMTNAPDRRKLHEESLGQKRERLAKMPSMRIAGTGLEYLRHLRTRILGQVIR